MRQMKLTNCNLRHTPKPFHMKQARLHKHSSAFLNSVLGLVGGPESNANLRTPSSLNGEENEH